MKKTIIALSIAGFVASVQAAPQANTFYAGAKAGWASFHDGLNQFENSAEKKGTVRNSVAYGIFGGYQITDHVAVELGSEYFGQAKGRKDKDEAKHTAQGMQLGLKASYPVLEGLDIYGRVGAALIRSNYLNVEKFESDKDVKNTLKVSPVFAAGVEYSLPSLPELALRLEYQWVKGVGKALKKSGGERLDYTPSIGAVTLGLSYRFGQKPVMAPEVVNKVFSLNSDVNFAFAKDTLKPEAQQTLDGVYGEIAQLKTAQVSVAGYTDRIGSDVSNLKLSQRRADTVANYLVSKGVAQDAISAVGYGEANPVTGMKCDAVKGRKALIACLAEDRRVEISVKGSK